MRYHTYMYKPMICGESSRVVLSSSSLSRPPHPLCSFTMYSGRAPNHDNYIKRYLRTGEKRAMGKKRKLRARRRDGSEFPIELGLTEVQVREGEERSFCGFIRDLSKEEEQRIEVMRKQRLMAGILDATFDALFAINEKGIIQLVNNAAVDQFGWSRSELVGCNISKIVG